MTTQIAPNVISKNVRQFITAVHRSANAWETANNYGKDDKTYQYFLMQHQTYGEQAANIAAKYGCKCDWPGLYPTVTDKHGRTEYATTDVNAMVRCFTDAMKELNKEQTK